MTVEGHEFMKLLREVAERKKIPATITSEDVMRERIRQKRELREHLKKEKNIAS